MLRKEEVEHIAELAKLALTDEEKERYRTQLSAILDYAAQLQSLDTSNIPPTASVLPVNTVLREDKARPGMPRENLLANAHAQEEGMFRVDVVLDEANNG
jgi:aspartyl-tRNA(Asn)/glutamyl-tRNA(Gln) amidotransferase subunit C